MVHTYREMMNMTRRGNDSVVLLQSGGLDSCYLAGLLDYCGFIHVHHLFVDYGQNSREAEERAAREICKSYGRAHVFHKAEMRLPWLQDATRLVGDSVVGAYDNLPDGAVSAKTYVPMRNAMLLGLASSLAESLGITNIAAAFEGVETFYRHKPLLGVPDKHRTFVERMETALTEGSTTKHNRGKKFTMITPLLGVSKEYMIRSANTIGVDLSKSWSCYNHGDKPCGKCCSCLSRIQYFLNEGIYDPAFTQEEIDAILAKNGVKKNF
jgi:7-cyano-7-deazaguanine synthase